MNLSIGDALTIMSILSFILAIIYKLIPSRKGNYNTINTQCSEHLNIATEQATIKTTLESVETGVAELKEGQRTLSEKFDNFIGRFIQV